MKDSRQQRAKSFSLYGLRRSERKRTKRAPMEAAIERNDLVAARVITGQLDGCLNRFSAGIAEEYFLGLFTGSHGREALRQLNHVRRIKIGPGNVDQLGGLLLNRFDHAWMAMSGGDHGEPRGKTPKRVAAGAPNDGAAPG